MWDLMDIGKVIGMKQSGRSNREINRETGYDREKISKVWSRYSSQIAQMGEVGTDIREIQEEMKAEPKYDSSKRGRRKYTAEIEGRLRNCKIITCEKTKNVV